MDPNLNPNTTPQQNPTVIDEYHERVHHHWLALTLYVIAALIVAFFVVFGVRAIYRHNHHSNTPAVAVKVTSTGSTLLPSKSAPAVTHRSSSTSSSSSTHNSSHSSTSKNDNSNGKIADTGPGQVVGLFAATAIAAGGAHYLISSKRKVKI